MDKLCRGCEYAHYPRSCSMIGTKRREAVWPNEKGCYYREPRETPLLVDELRNALLNLLVEFDHLIDHGAEPCDEDCAEEARTALTRYDKEVGDA